jgi:hypothetical protein
VNTLPIICHGCGRRTRESMSAIASLERCASCGSDDLDVDNNPNPPIERPVTLNGGLTFPSEPPTTASRLDLTTQIVDGVAQADEAAAAQRRSAVGNAMLGRVGGQPHRTYLNDPPVTPVARARDTMVGGAGATAILDTEPVVRRVTAHICETNPGIDTTLARRMAEGAVARYPEMLG